MYLQQVSLLNVLSSGVIAQLRTCFTECIFEGMGVGPLIFGLVVVFFLTLVLLNKYGDWQRQHCIVMISTFMGWYFSFVIMFMLPLDIAIVSLSIFHTTHNGWFKMCMKQQSQISKGGILASSSSR